MNLRELSPVIFFLAILAVMSTASLSSAVDTVWNFDGDLSPASGSATMQYRGATASMTSFGTTGSLGLPALYGDDGTTNVMTFPTFPRTDTSSLGYSVMHGVGVKVPEYTMVWDVLYPESSDMHWRDLYQTNIANSNDGDFFVQNNPWGGIGISSRYRGVIKPGEWNRIVLTRDTNGKMMKYINGGFVDEHTLNDTRWRLDANQYLILCDDNGNTDGGYIASHRFIDRVMTQEEVFQLGGASAAGGGTSGQVFADPSAVEPGSFSIAILPDTQGYATGDTNAQTFNSMTQWLVNNKETHNIQYVTHVGDIVNSNYTSEWDRAVTALSTLDGQIPYALAPGNHDYGGSRAVSQFDDANRYGPGTPYASQDSLDGFYPAEPNSRMNTYHTLEVGGQKLLILALEFGPRDAVVDWAETVVDAHPDHRTILVTHAYMFNGGHWFDHSVDPDDPQGRTYDQVLDDKYNRTRSVGNPHSYGFVSSDCNDGRELWDKLVKDRENISLVLTGHQFDEHDGFPYQLNEGENGNQVYQMLFDTQTRPGGGEGWIRLLEFSPDGQTVTVKSYSPYFDQWSFATDENYTIELSAMGPMPGDANNDGQVDVSDLGILATNYGAGSGMDWEEGDFTGDGAVDVSDLGILATNYGTSADTLSVPEPSMIILMVLCVLWLAGRRSRGK